jgi:hypothetical protein
MIMHIVAVTFLATAQVADGTDVHEMPRSSFGAQPFNDRYMSARRRAPSAASNA